MLYLGAGCFEVDESSPTFWDLHIYFPTPPYYVSMTYMLQLWREREGERGKEGRGKRERRVGGGGGREGGERW